MADFEFYSMAPREELRPFVEAIWGVRGAGDFGTEAVLPNGSIELMVNFGPVQGVVARGADPLRQSFRDAWLAGIHDRRLVHSSRHGVDHISVRFRPGGAHAFFDIGMDEAANDVIELELLIGREAIHLRDRLGELPTDEARGDLFQEWLLRRRRVHSGFVTVSRAIAMLRDRPARASVAAVCDGLGISNKHLIAQFRRIVGLPPKVLARVLRFQGVVDACQTRGMVDWADLAHDAGYADQSHLIREFRRFACMTPGELRGR